METQSDIESIGDANIGKFGQRIVSPITARLGNPFTKFTEATNISGGTLSSNTVINIGSKLVRIDGKKGRIIINDGVNDRVIIGNLA